MGDQILVWKSVRLFLPDMRCYKFQCPVVIQFLFPLTLFWMIICKDHERLTKFLSLFLQCKMVKISASEILLHKVILKIGIDLGSVRIVPHYILPIRIDATPSGVNLIPLSSRFSDSQGGGGEGEQLSNTWNLKSQRGFKFLEYLNCIITETFLFWWKPSKSWIFISPQLLVHQIGI